MSRYDLIDLIAKYKSRTKRDTLFVFAKHSWYFWWWDIYLLWREERTVLICFKMTLGVSFAFSYDYAFTFSTGLAGTTRTTNELGVAACRHFSKRTNLNNDKLGKRKAKISILTLMGFLCVTQSQSIDRTAVARMVAWISFQKGGAGWSGYSWHGNHF